MIMRCPHELRKYPFSPSILATCDMQYSYVVNMGSSGRKVYNYSASVEFFRSDGQKRHLDDREKVIKTYVRSMADDCRYCSWCECLAGTIS